MTDAVKNLGPIAIAALKTWNGIAKASLKTINGITVSHAPTDPLFANVVLLQNFDGDLTDAKSHTVTAVGNAVYSTVRHKFGLGSCLLDGSGDEMSLADSADWYMGAGDWTIEGHFYFATAWNTFNVIINQYTGTLSTSFLYLDIRSSGTAINNVTAYGGSQDNLSGNPGLSLDTWYHICIERFGTGLTLYVEGVSKATASVSTHSYNDSTGALEIGGCSVDSRWMAGNVGSMRITKGVARYKGAFTPPSAKYPTA